MVPSKANHFKEIKMFVVAIKDVNPVNVIGFKFWNGYKVSDTENVTIPDYTFPKDKNVLNAFLFTNLAAAESEVERVKKIIVRHTRKEGEVVVMSLEQVVEMMQAIK